MYAPDRRRFLQRLLGGVAATAAVPSVSVAKAYRHTAPPYRQNASNSLRRLSNAVSRLSSSDPGDERFWQLVKNQFPLRPDLIFMNAANLCPSPYPVIDTVFQLTRDVDADASYQNRSKFSTLREQARSLLADYVGASPDEIAITRNTSEGNNTVINGLTLGPGDEVVIWDQNHPTNNVAWDVRAGRYGFTVKSISTPPSPRTADQLIRPFREGFSSNTRVLAFSHVSNVSGVGLPVQEICGMARERGILTLIDGAQTFGALRVDLHQIGCDFYTGSAHKWLVGPKEVGVLYVKRERIEELWPSAVGVGWASALENGARKFETLGQRDDAAVAAMGTAVSFHQEIGVDRLEERVRSLATAIKRAVGQRVSRARFHTPIDPELSAGVVVFELPRVDASQIFARLYKEHNIGCAAMSGEFAGIRLSPHIYNTMEDVERVVGAIASLL